MNSLLRAPPWVILLTGMMVTLVAVTCARLAFGLILPFMRESLGLSYQQVGNLGTACALGYFCLVMAAGSFAARHGSRAAVLTGLGLTTAGFVGLALASHYLLLLVFMVVLGFGTAFAYTPVISLLAGCFPERRGAAIGIVNGGVGLGLLLSGMLVPVLMHQFGEIGWRLAWTVFALTSALTAAASFMFLPNPAGQAGPGAKLSLGPMLRNRHLLKVALIYGVIGITYIAQATFMYSFALDAGLAPATAAPLVAIMGILSTLAGPFWGWLSDRFGRRATLVASLSLTMVATLLPVLWPVLWGFAAHFIILGCTISGMFTAVLAASTESVEPQQAPRALSFVTLIYAGGQFVGPAIAGALIEHGGGFRVAFGATCVVMAGGVMLAWTLRPPVRTAAIP